MYKLCEVYASSILVDIYGIAIHVLYIEQMPEIGQKDTTIAEMTQLSISIHMFFCICVNSDVETLGVLQCYTK